MEDLSGGETTSYLSAPSMTSVSVMDAPTYLYREYEPLEEVFASHSVPLPKLDAGIKDSNSEGKTERYEACLHLVSSHDRGSQGAAG